MPENTDRKSGLKEGKILTRDQAAAMETRVMSLGCTDADFRRLMDSHESLRSIVKWYVESVTRQDTTKPTRRVYGPPKVWESDKPIAPGDVVFDA